MTVVPPIEIPFEVTYDSDSLDVAMKVFDTTSGTPSLLDTIAMTSLVGNTYFASYTFENAKTYVVHKAVYTDGTFTTLSDDYSQASESLACASLGPQRGVALPKFQFPMTADDSHVPLTGLTPRVQVSKDGGAFANSTNSSAELSDGVYQIDLTASEMDARSVMLKFTNIGADTRFTEFIF